MITDLSEDIIEIVIKQIEIDDYYSLKLVNKHFRLMLKTKRFDILYYHFSKEMIKKVLNQNTIKYCTNANCPNKLHCSNIATVLSEKDLDYNSMIEYRDILLSLRGKKNDNTVIRFDYIYYYYIYRTISYEYSNIDMLNIMKIPYCEDCLLEYNPELYTYIEENLLMY